MDCRNGDILKFENSCHAEEMTNAFKKDHSRRLLELTQEQAKILEPMPRRMRKNKMRNKPCICGSGIKFKRCCWSKYA